MKRRIREVVAVVMALAMVMGMMPGLALRTEASSEEGTKTNPIVINTEIAGTSSDKYYTVTADGRVKGYSFGTILENQGYIENNEGLVEVNRGEVNYNLSKGTILVNENEIPYNRGMVTTNKGTIDNNEENGTVTTNEGTVTSNKGNATITTNAKVATVVTNNATITSNAGTVTTNNNAITTNESGGNVDVNGKNGTVTTNKGQVKDNQGTVVDNDYYIITNNGTVKNNSYNSGYYMGDVTSQQSFNDGIQHNYGLVEMNISRIGYNGDTSGDQNKKGTIKVNRGYVDYNNIASTIEHNEWIVSVNSGTITNNIEEGKVNKNSGTVVNNYAVIDQSDNGSVTNQYRLFVIGADQNTTFRVSGNHKPQLYDGSPIEGRTDYVYVKDGEKATLTMNTLSGYTLNGVFYQGENKDFIRLTPKAGTTNEFELSGDDPAIPAEQKSRNKILVVCFTEEGYGHPVVNNSKKDEKDEKDETEEPGEGGEDIEIPNPTGDENAEPIKLPLYDDKTVDLSELLNIIDDITGKYNVGEDAMDIKYDFSGLTREEAITSIAMSPEVMEGLADALKGSSGKGTITFVMGNGVSVTFNERTLRQVAFLHKMGDAVPVKYKIDTTVEFTEGDIVAKVAAFMELSEEEQFRILNEKMYADVLINTELEEIEELTEYEWTIDMGMEYRMLDREIEYYQMLIEIRDRMMKGEWSEDDYWQTAREYYEQTMQDNNVAGKVVWFSLSFAMDFIDLFFGEGLDQAEWEHFNPVFALLYEGFRDLNDILFGWMLGSSLTDVEGYKKLADESGSAENEESEGHKGSIVIRNAEFNKEYRITKGSPIYLKCDHGENCVLHDFTDTDASAWYHDGLHLMVQRENMKGIGEKKLAPNREITRAEFVTLLYRTTRDDREFPEISFGDVAKSDYYYDAVRWAVGFGIAKGYGNGLFGADDLITREQMAAMMTRMFNNGQDIPQIDDMKEVLQDYIDEDEISGYARNPMAALAKLMIMEGTSENTLSPKGYATRAQAAAVIQRLLALYGAA